MPARPARRVGRMICDVVKPDGEPYEGDPRHVLRRALERMKRWASTRSTSAPSSSTSSSRTQRHRDARRGRLLRHDRAGRRDRPALRDDQGARGDGDPDRVPPPRGGAVAARDRHALRARARDGRLHAHLPADRQGDRRQARRLRDLHAEAAVRRERSGMHTHMSLFKDGRNQFFDRTTRTTSRAAGKRSSPACSSTRARSPRSSRSG